MTSLSWVLGIVTDATRRRPAATSLLFGMTLRMSGIALPVYMAHEGLAVSTIGLVVAASGLTQLAVRPWLATLLRRFSDRSIIVTAILILSGSGLAVLAGPYFAVFLLAQLLQGAARALYWTASQTYVVRGKDRSAGALAEVNFASSVGALLGPTAAGFLVGHSLPLTVLATGVVPLLGLLFALRLDYHEPFPPRAREASGAAWRTDMVRAGCWAGVAAGAWEGLVGSYVPVLLLASDVSPGGIGLILSASNLGGVLGGLLAARVSRHWTRASLWAGAAITGVGLACTAAWPGQTVSVALSLVVAGTTAGMLRTLGPAAATDSATEASKGDVLTATGTYRALSLVVTPALVGGLVIVTTLPVAMVAVALTVTGTGVPTWWYTRGPRPTEA